MQYEDIAVFLSHLAQVLSRTGEQVSDLQATAFPPTNKVKLNLVLEITKSN
jgi:hypothetical protein